MKKPSQTQLNHHGIKPANLSEEQFNSVLRSFSGAKQMARVISGIYSEQGMLTHTISRKLYCNNVSDIRQKANSKLLKHGLKLVCIPQTANNPLTKSFHWYLCFVGEVEYFPVDQESANDGAL